MAEFTKSELKKSLRESISLMVRGCEIEWVTFEEIHDFTKEGFVLFNTQKQDFYNKTLGRN